MLVLLVFSGILLFFFNSGRTNLLNNNSLISAPILFLPSSLVSKTS
jgi:hypothetical protein